MNEPPGAILKTFAASWGPRVERVLEDAVPDPSVAPMTLHAAMRHALFPGGKRLRPVLALMAARVTGGDPKRALRPSAALECLHTYSLVHDDLPCMDDDELRRGRPTCHVAFGEAAAVLAGDALLTLAFELAAEGGADAVTALARGAGHRGMVGGQMLDLEAEHGAGERCLERVQGIHDRKTGALIGASLQVGALSGGGDRHSLPALAAYGEAIGRAFQIADDCLDRTASALALGKSPGKDQAQAKLTYPAVLGLEESLHLARELAASAVAAIPAITARSGRCGPELDGDRALLQDVALYTVHRSH